ncbi:hypothetical protein ES705_17939 [subsurface metagenome]
MASIFFILFYTLFPALVLYLAQKYSLIRRIGSVVICYAVGLLIGNIGILPENSQEFQDVITTIAIPLAIPLMLFSLDARSWFKIAPKTMLSLILGLVSMLVMVFLGYFLFKEKIDETWKVSGLLVGVYSGGTPNIAAIKMVLNVDPDTYILTHTYDLIIGAFLLLFLITGAQRFFLLFMKPYRYNEDRIDDGKTFGISEDFESYSGIFRRPVFLPLLKAIGFSILIFGIGAGLSLIVPENAKMAVVILCITTLGILASLLPFVNKIGKTFQTGMYLILIFCLVVASMADISKFNLSSMPLFTYIFIAVIGSLFLHAILSAIFKINVDDFLVTTTALAMSPPFVPVIAAALKNKKVIIPGLVVGIIGYAVGNYLGVFVATVLK